MRTLSARILLGFAALTLAFGLITANELYNLHQVENEIRLVNNGYLPLALISKELERLQADLAYYADHYESDPNPLRYTHPRRDQTLVNLAKTTANAEALPEVGIKRFELLSKIQAQVAATAPLYEQLKSLKHTPDGGVDTDGRALLANLHRAEAEISLATNELASEYESRVHRVMSDLEDNGRKVAIYTIYLGSTAVILGILMTLWVIITLRPLHQLREAARRVAAGDYGSRIVERGPAEVADLAREFNAMGRAVEERERELVRSERLAAVGKMAAMITHEVRNPLSSIGLNTELLQEELADPSSDLAEAKQLCTAIHREVDRLTQITEEYLAFSRLPKPKLAREPVNVLVRALADFVREDLAAKQVKLVVDPSPSDPQALIDAAQVRQCLINLVRNAADAVVTKGGGTVTLRTRKLDQRVVIAVEDDGSGVPADVLPRMFDPFFSTKESGSGLGLALTQQIVKDHGGEVSVDSSVGKGTTVTVSVPAANV